jgi:hypothetical protein
MTRSRPAAPPALATRLRDARLAFNDAADVLARATTVADCEARRLLQAELDALAAGITVGVRSSTWAAWRGLAESPCRHAHIESVPNHQSLTTGEEVSTVASAARRPLSIAGSTARDDRERGSLTVFLMVIALAIFATIALGVDSGRMLTAHGEAVSTAAAAAAAAAAAPPSQRLAAATAVATDNRMTLTCLGTSCNGQSAGPGQMCASVTRTQDTWMLGVIGIKTFTATDTQCAS